MLMDTCIMKAVERVAWEQHRYPLEHPIASLMQATVPYARVDNINHAITYCMGHVSCNPTNHAVVHINAW